MVLVPISVFEKALDKQLSRTIRPASKKYLGKKLRVGGTITIVQEMWERLTSIENQFIPPHIEATEKSPGLERTPEGKVIATKITASAEKFKIKLRDPAHVAAFCRMEVRSPSRGYQGAMLIKRKHAAAKRVAMAAGPLILECRIPRGHAATESLPSMTYKMNVIMMDENSDVTFGNKDYPAAVCFQICLVSPTPYALRPYIR